MTVGAPGARQALRPVRSMWSLSYANVTTMEVGIRELKRRLSEFVERAAGGQVIRVTAHGRPKAILGPLPGSLDLKRGEAEGWIAPGADDPPAAARRRHRATRTIAETLAEDRGA